jgi:histone-lysine N-methyltransferase SUV420H
MKYLSVYLPSCPFEICSTRQYKRVEAAIIARKSIKVGETIKYLCGTRALLTEDEEAEMGRRDNNFSILKSSRHGVALMLGPTRFLNHDCAANARLETDGQAGMAVIATRRIDPGEEITVPYGTDYFGERNRECLCKTCEDDGLNGWKGRGGSLGCSVAPDDKVMGKRKRAPSSPTPRKKPCWKRQRIARHKKTYGYDWPKTERVGKPDQEERFYADEKAVGE